MKSVLTKVYVSSSPERNINYSNPRWYKSILSPADSWREWSLFLTHEDRRPRRLTQEMTLDFRPTGESKKKKEEERTFFYTPATGAWSNVHGGGKRPNRQSERRESKCSICSLSGCAFSFMRPVYSLLHVLSLPSVRPQRILMMIILAPRDHCDIL